MNELKDSFQWLNDQKESMLSLLIELAKQNSGTANIDGIKRVAKILEKPLMDLGTNIVHHKLPEYSEIDFAGLESSVQSHDFTIATKRGNADKQLLLGGHLDTVYEKEEQLIEVKGDYLHGPGVADMKGGLVIMLYALQAFENMDIKHKMGWQIFLSSDEETGSLAAKEELAKLAKRHSLAFIFEPAINLQGDIAGNRMGSGKFTIVVSGRSAHVGRSFDQGRNAIVMLASMIEELHSWNMLEDNIVINVGKIVGGDVINRVPDLAVVKIDVRIKDQHAGDWFTDKISKLIAHTNQADGFSAKLYGSFTRPVKKLTDNAKKVNSRVQAIAHTLNQEINIVSTGGCCDGNNLSEYECVTIDTLGVLGSDIHSNRERMLINSLVSRSQLVLALMFHYQQGELL